MAAFFVCLPKVGFTANTWTSWTTKYTRLFTKCTRHSRIHILKLSEPCGFLVYLVVNSKISWLTENREELRSFKRGINQNINIRYANNVSNFLPSHPSLIFLQRKTIDFRSIDDWFSYSNFLCYLPS
jgi:hypothetical protein